MQTHESQGLLTGWAFWLDRFVASQDVLTVDSPTPGVWATANLVIPSHVRTLTVTFARVMPEPGGSATGSMSWLAFIS